MASTLANLPKKRQRLISEKYDKAKSPFDVDDFMPKVIVDDDSQTEPDFGSKPHAAASSCPDTGASVAGDIVTGFSDSSPRETQARELSLFENVVNDDKTGLYHKLRTMGMSENDLQELERKIVDETPKSHQVDQPSAAEETIKQQLDSGNIDTRTGYGQRVMSRIKANEEAFTEYRSLDRQKASEFRANWASQELKYLREERSSRQRWKRVDTTRGRYLPFSKMVSEEGGDREALHGAVRVVQKCLAMGYPWVHKHPQTERYEYLLLSFEWSEEFEESWATWKIHFGNVSHPGKGLQSAPEPVVNATLAKRKTTPPTKKDDDSVAKLVAKANKLKTKMSRAMAGAQQLIDSIEASEGWQWADNDPNRGELQRRLSKVKDSMNGFASAFLVLDAKELKKKTDSTSWAHELKIFLDLDVYVEQLSQFSSRLTRMHSSTPSQRA